MERGPGRRALEVLKIGTMLGHVRGGGQTQRPANLSRSTHTVTQIGNGTRTFQYDRLSYNLTILANRLGAVVRLVVVLVTFPSNGAHGIPFAVHNVTYQTITRGNLGSH